MVVRWRPFQAQIIRRCALLFAEYRRRCYIRCYSVAIMASKPFDNVDVFEQGNGKPLSPSGASLMSTGLL
jgi:hypothetical protein